MADVPVKDELIKWYRTGFDAFAGRLNGGAAGDIHKKRVEAIEKFTELGFPTTSNEEWKYTNIAPVLKYAFNPSHLSEPVEVAKKDIEKYLLPGLTVSLFVFINGHYNAALSSLLPEAQAVTCTDLSKLLTEEPHLFESFLTENYADGFSALNNAFLSEGAVLKIPDGTILENPLHLLFLSGHDKDNLLVQPHNFIFAGKNSSLSIVETNYGLSGKPYLFNSVTDISAGEYANVNYYKLQNDSSDSFHVSRTKVHQNRSSVFTSGVVTVGGELVRNDIAAHLSGEGSEANLYGLYLADGKRHIDNHTLIDHAVPHCSSNELYKGILDDKSRGVFNGKVLVRKDAQKTQAYQSNKNLLLSRMAKADTKPQLEIFADDVKCSHGATVGQLDDQAMFYLRSRGIGTETARSILINAFAGDVIDLIKIEQLRDDLNKIILDKLHSAAVR